MFRTQEAPLDIFTRISDKVSQATGTPLAFVISCLVVAVWGISGPVFHYSDTWQLIINTGTTVITFLMVFIIQNGQNRDMAALHSKLDELLRAQADARNELIGLEHRSEKEIKEMREAIETECRDDPD